MPVGSDHGAREKGKPEYTPRRSPPEKVSESAVIKVAIINESTVVKDADVLACVLALQVQVTRDFCPAWNINAQLNFHPSKIAPEDAWQLVILDDSDQADALGYHELTAGGLPLGKVFAGSDIQAGTSWTVTASHELLEMLADPDINEVSEVDNADGSITFYAKEVCDAVEADALGYTIDGVNVSDFVYPAWFESVPAEIAGPLDHLGRVTTHLALAPGGYISLISIPQGGPTWQQITANRRPGGPAAARGSRRWRRQLTDSMWRRSRSGR